MKENKKLETSNTEVVAEPPIQIIDTRREIDDLSDAELKELEKELEQYDKDMWQHLDCLQKYKHIGEEIPKDVPFTEYFGYIFQNFRNPKPKEEWTDVDYKADYSRWQRLHVASVLGQQLSKQTIPLIDRQKRIIERVRNGTDFDIFSSKKFLEMLS